MEGELNKLLDAEKQQLTKLQEIVRKAVEEEKLIIDNLLHQPREVLTRGQHISDKVARFGGSWSFILSFAVILIGWILFNTLAPHPLNLCRPPASSSTSVPGRRYK